MIFVRAHDPEINATLYVSGELTRRMRRWFESHLLECEERPGLARADGDVAHHRREHDQRRRSRGEQHGGGGERERRERHENRPGAVPFGRPPRHPRERRG